MYYLLPMCIEQLDNNVDSIRLGLNGDPIVHIF